MLDPLTTYESVRLSTGFHEMTATLIKLGTREN